MILVALFAPGVSSLLTAATPPFTLVLAARVLGAAIGTPIGHLVADLSDWRVAFAGLGTLLLLAAPMVRILVPDLSRPAVTATAGTASGGMRTLVVIAAIVAIALIGHYGAYTFITRIGAPTAQLPGGMSGVLVLFGIASAAGIVLAAHSGRRTVRWLLSALGITAIAVAALAIHIPPFIAAAVVALSGMGSGAFPPLALTLILRLAGESRRDFASALIPVLFNGGIAVGAAAASAVAAAAGPRAVAIPAAVIVGAAAVTLGVAWRATLAKPTTAQVH